MMLPLRPLFCFLLIFSSGAASSPLLTDKPSPADFPLARPGSIASLVVEPNSDRAVRRAAADLQTDLERVTSQRAPLLDALPDPAQSPHVVIIGTLGQSALIDQLAAEGRLDVTELRGAWESFVIQTIASPAPGVQQALVIAGSDRRGTIYGIYELSQAIGVSPWHWWADVPPPRREFLHLAAQTHRFGPPSVKYRGIFINDEDWALQPWAAHTHEPENDDIGPKTYARVFELLLRLKANLLWPAMHPSTKPFNHFPENKDLADAYGIVMGSSHAEPMLRNNVGEWKAPAADYNYVTNREGVLAYWQARLSENGRYENVYTLGMRGIHDSNMVGPRNNAERVSALERIFGDQRTLLRDYAREGEAAPQMFCAYKEVLELYRAGLKVPEDVTIVWPDDNFGYIRNFATAEERARAGGFGVYYHASYLGRPLAYLWLNTTPPALIWQEMIKAYEHGADRMWIVNVGDIKPAEIATEFFLQMAWDIQRWDEQTLPDFLPTWAQREFGPEHAGAIARLLADYYVLNFQRKPEHLQWWLAGEVPRPSPLSTAEIEARLRAFRELTIAAEQLAEQLPPIQRDAFFQLVLYPIVGSAAANERFFHAEQYARNFNHHLELARRHAAAAVRADARLTELTAQFNTTIANGKWRHFMTLEPADNQWRSMRIAQLPLPAANLSTGVPPAGPELRHDETPEQGTVVMIDAGDFARSQPQGSTRWVTVPGLGRSGRAVTIRPSTAESREQPSTENAPFLEYIVSVSEAGPHQLEVQLLPTHALVPGNALRVAIGINAAPPQVVAHALFDGSPQWAHGVLESTLRATVSIEFPQAGSNRLRLYMVDAGVVVDRLVLHRGPVSRSYFGPAIPLQR